MKHLFGSILSAIALVVCYLELAGKKVPFLPDGYRSGFYIVFVIGLIACSVGGIGANTAGNKIDWLNPFTLVGSVLGVVAVFLLVLVATHKHFWIIQSDRSALFAIGLIIAAKWLLTLFMSVSKSI